jgi:hypothetical protein
MCQDSAGDESSSIMFLRAATYVNEQYESSSVAQVRFVSLYESRLRQKVRQSDAIRKDLLPGNWAIIDAEYGAS